MPAPNAIHDLPQRIIGALDIEPEWIVRDGDGDGVGFVAGELGVWLEVRDTPAWTSVLRVEARLARHIPDGPHVRELCQDWNQLSDIGSLIGRWVHDPATGVLALIADLPSFHESAAADGMVTLYAEIVALITSSAEIAAHNSGRWSHLGGVTALILVNCHRRRRAEALLDRVPEMKRAGKDPGRAHAVEDLVRQSLPDLLSQWMQVPWAPANSPRLELLSAFSTELVVFAAEHPRVGWGIMISTSLIDEDTRRKLITESHFPDLPELDASVETLAKLNREAAATGGIVAGSWIGGRGGVEHRAFIPAALLAIPSSADVSCAVVNTFAHVIARQFHSVYRREPSDIPVLLRPSWPGDEEAEVLARREPYNDGPRPGNHHAACHFTDALGRVCGINADSLALWESRLTDQDRTAPGVLDFPRITSGFIVPGGSHRGED